MKATIIFIAVLLCFIGGLHGQTRTIYGHIIHEELLPLPIPDFHIQINDSLLIVKTDINGKFKINIPQNTQTLLFNWIGFEEANIKLNDDCDTVEIVMMPSGSYDFMSSRRVDRERLAMFNKLPELYLQAYKKGIFTKESPCYFRRFEPEKPRFDEIQKEYIKKEKQIKLTFKRLAMGDTIRIPFSGQYRADGTDRTTLTAYSSFTNEKKFDYIIKCIVIGKNTNKKHYNLICEVVNYEAGKHPIVYNHSIMEAGLIFTHNMKYFKILDE